MRNQEQFDKLVTGLRPYRDYIVQHGRLMSSSYPVSSVPAEVFSVITVPVPLPVALLLFGIGAALAADTPEQPDASQGG